MVLGEKGGVTANGYGVPLWGDGNVLKLITMMVAKPVNIY